MKSTPIPDIPACVEVAEPYYRAGQDLLKKNHRNGVVCPTLCDPASPVGESDLAVPPPIDLAEKGVNLIGRYAAKLAETERMHMREKLRACKAEQQLNDAKRIMETGMIQEGVEGAIVVLESILFRYDDTELCRECDCPKLAGSEFCPNCDTRGDQ